MFRVYLNLPESSFCSPKNHTFSKVPDITTSRVQQNQSSALQSEKNGSPQSKYPLSLRGLCSSIKPCRSRKFDKCLFLTILGWNFPEKQKGWFMTWTRVFEGKNALEIYDVLWRYSYNVIYNVIYIYTRIHSFTRNSLNAWPVSISLCQLAGS